MLVSVGKFGRRGIRKDEAFRIFREEVEFNCVADAAGSVYGREICHLGGNLRGCVEFWEL